MIEEYKEIIYALQGIEVQKSQFEIFLKEKYDKLKEIIKKKNINYEIEEGITNYLPFLEKLIVKTYGETTESIDEKIVREDFLNKLKIKLENES
ncbi:MAG: hypothetical protein P8X70_03010 [Nanoarchaeota archaeon]